MTALGLYYEDLDERRAIATEREAFDEAVARLAELMGGSEPVELRDDGHVHDLASDAIWFAAKEYGIEPHEVGTEADVIAALVKAPALRCAA